MKNLIIKSTSILMIILLAVMINSIIFTNPLLTTKAEAAGLEKSDIVTGLGIAFVLYLLFESTDNDDLVESEIDESELNNDRDYDIEIDSINLKLLAKIIHAEARGESFEGQVAVGAVIVNRMESSEFPNTIEEVLYQSNQFQSVANDQFDLHPNQTAYRAARRAIDGEDPSKGALFFFNPKKSKNPEAFERYEVTVRIGNHVFAK
ncbi:MAG: cell wall hydrolase [Halanaerobiales bacterium]